MTKGFVWRHRLGVLLRLVAMPAAVYSLCFALAMYPLVTKFSDVLWSDAQDAWVTLWNFWWVNKALTELHQLPWHTTWIHYPYGISLWTHTLNVYNSLLAIGLVNVLSPIQTYNLLLFLTFPLAGIAVFLFAYYFTRAYTASLLAGYAFAFSNYHIGHARAHLNLSSIEFIPIFVLCWYILLQKPTRLAALGAAVALLLTTLSDYYLLFYCVLAAGGMLIWKIVKERDVRFFFMPTYRGPWVLFVVTALVTLSPLVVPLVIATLQDPTGGHNPERFSLDLVAIVVPGRAWRFAPLTSNLWSRWSGNPVENNVALGFGNLALVVSAWFQRKRPGNASIVLWTLMLALFLILSLGPRLHVNGDIVSFFRLPYGILLDALPLLAVSGVPVRMMLMVSLFAAVLGGFAFAALFAGTRWQRMFGVALAVLLVFETFPKLDFVHW